MRRFHFFNLGGLLVVAGATYACSSSGTSGPASPQWTCGASDVPNGHVTECVAPNSGSVAIAYDCVSGAPGCPPATTGDAGASSDDASAPTPPPPSDYDAAVPSPTPPPPPPPTEYDAGGGTTGGGGDGDAGLVCHGNHCVPGPGYDAGAGGGNGHGNGGGNGNGNGGGNGNGNGGSCDGGSHEGPPPAPPPWHCEPNDDGDMDCTTPPTCDPGYVPAPCGACVPQPQLADPIPDCRPPAEGGCWVTGGGFIASGSSNDSFGGNAMPMKDGSVRGEWENVDHASGATMHGQAQYIVCRTVAGAGPGHPNGPSHNFGTNQAYFGGPAKWQGNDGYWFDVMVEDHGEPGRQDVYHVTIRQMAGNGQSGQVVFDDQGTLAGGGNIQIHPPNAGHPASSSTLPSWVQLQP